MSRKKGWVGQRKRDGRWFARITVDGKDKIKFAQDKAHAEWLLQCLILGLDTSTTAPSKSSATYPATAPFKRILEQFRRIRVQPAQYRGDKKISGIRSVRETEVRMKVLEDWFGDYDVSSITVSVVQQFKLERLATPTRHGKERAVASVNRELEVLRAILRFAQNEGHITRSPFEVATVPIIVKSHETRRVRILSDAEEKRLLKACETPARKHLIPLIILAVETGMRAGEMKALRWRDLDIGNYVIRVRATTSKTMTAREIPISKRLMDALPLLAASSGGKKDDLVVSLKKWTNGWKAALEDAKITGLRWHDLRATFATRMLHAGVSAEVLSKITGHSTTQILYSNYIRTDKTALDAVRAALDNR